MTMDFKFSNSNRDIKFTSERTHRVILKDENNEEHEIAIFIGDLSNHGKITITPSCDLCGLVEIEE
jgi:hypothetical protein